MEFAVNYSPALAELVREGRVHIDRFKCPAWPDLLEQASQVLPVYVHFPLKVGNGLGGPVDEEQNALADLDRVAEIKALTGTPLVNTHFGPSGKQYPEIAVDSRSPRDIQRVVNNTLRDLEPLIQRFGAENVTLENLINAYGYLNLAVMPEVIARVLEATGCGFLFDLSHARLAARNLGLDPRAYCAAMPVERIREIHVTGLQVMGGALLERVTAAGYADTFPGNMAGQWIDHLPMTDADWPELEWLAGEIRAGRFNQPWVIAYEFGGVGGFWEMVSERETYLAEIPRMKRVISD